MAGVKKEIDQQMPEIIKEMDKKTRLYALWSLAGILLISINFPKAVFYALSFLMVLAAVYFLMGFIRSLRKLFSFIDSFEKEIKKIVKPKIELAVRGSFKSQSGLNLSGYDQKDIENLCIAYFVRELAKRFKKYKQYILTRVAAYTVAVLLFKEVLFNLLT